MNLFADSGAWQALYDAGDKYHALAGDAFRSLTGQRVIFYITDYVFDETVTLVRGRARHRQATLCGDWLIRSPRVRLVYVTPQIWNEAWEMFKQYDDKNFSFTDCTSFVVMRQQGLRDVFSFDRHFEQMGYRLWPH